MPGPGTVPGQSRGCGLHSAEKSAVSEQVEEFAVHLEAQCVTIALRRTDSTRVKIDPGAGAMLDFRQNAVDVYGIF